MKTTSIGFEITHTKDNLSPHESYPIVKCYLDARWNRDAIDVPLKHESQMATVTGTLRRDIKDLPVTAAIGFASFAWRKNESDNPCLMDTGVTHIYIGEIVEGLKKEETFTKDLKLIMHTVENYNKGAIRITFHRDKFDLGANVRIASYINIGRNMVDYINSTMEMEQQMAETFQGTERMRIPYDYSESGIESTNGEPLPAAAYVLSEIPKSNLQYWENAYANVMKRDGLKPEEWNRLNIDGKARTTILTVSYFSQYLDYIGDTVDRNVRGQTYSRQLQQPCENFGDPCTTYSGDCEDLSTGILQNYNAFVNFKFSDPHFIEMQEIARHYVPPLSLDVVHGAQVNQIATLGAHMNDNFIPVDKFKSWLETSKDGRALSKQLPWDPEVKYQNLPFMIGEGTGMYEPLGAENPLLPIMGYVYRAPSLEGFKKPITHKRTEIGAFFLGSLVGMTDYFYRRGMNAPLTFWYTTDGNRGASYDNMINHPEKVSIKPQPFISKPIMGVIEEAIKLRVPPNHLSVSKIDSHKHAKNSHLEVICKGINSMNRPSGPLAQHVPIYVRPHQLNKTIASKILSDFTKLNRIWKVDYVHEIITDEIWGYKVNVYVK